MTYGFVENTTAAPLVVATFSEIDFLRVGPPTCVYTVAPGETRPVLFVLLPADPRYPSLISENLYRCLASV